MSTACRVQRTLLRLPKTGSGDVYFRFRRGRYRVFTKMFIFKIEKGILEDLKRKKLQTPCSREVSVYLRNVSHLSLSSEFFILQASLAFPLAITALKGFANSKEVSVENKQGSSRNHFCCFAYIHLGC